MNNQQTETHIDEMDRIAQSKGDRSVGLPSKRRYQESQAAVMYVRTRGFASIGKLRFIARN